MRKEWLLTFIAIERLAGLVSVKLTLFMPLVGLLGFLRNPKIHPVAMPMIVLVGFAMISGWQTSYDLTTMIRSIQLLFMILFFNTLIMYCTADFLNRALLYLIPVMALVFLFELAVKPDMLRALFSLNYYYFWKSGGASFDSGVLLMAGGNVYAASTAGVCAVSAYFQRRYGWAGLALFLAVLTGSRALFLSLILMIILVLVHHFAPKLRRILITLFVIGMAVQPFLYYSVTTLLSADVQTFFYYLSPRYVAWIAHAHMGMDHLFGVGYFQGKTMVEYFWARWPIPAHNQTMVVFGEIGVFGWWCWVVFLWRLGALAKQSTYAAAMFVFPLGMYSFIGGFNEWSIWVPLALVVCLQANHKIVPQTSWIPARFLRPEAPPKVLPAQ